MVALTDSELHAAQVGAGRCANRRWASAPEDLLLNWCAASSAMTGMPPLTLSQPHSVPHGLQVMARHLSMIADRRSPNTGFYDEASGSAVALVPFLVPPEGSEGLRLVGWPTCLSFRRVRANVLWCTSGDPFAAACRVFLWWGASTTMRHDCRWQPSR